MDIGSVTTGSVGLSRRKYNDDGDDDDDEEEEVVGMYCSGPPPINGIRSDGVNPRTTTTVEENNR